MDIVRHGEVLVSSDGSLKLSEDNKVGSGEGLGSDTLPPLPDNVNQVAISWHANTEVRRKSIVSCLSVGSDSANSGVLRSRAS